MEEAARNLEQAIESERKGPPLFLYHVWTTMGRHTIVAHNYGLDGPMLEFVRDARLVHVFNVNFVVRFVVEEYRGPREVET
jgi:hypothetical protein